jgi:hypothetical protein
MIVKVNVITINNRPAACQAGASRNDWEPLTPKHHLSQEFVHSFLLYNHCFVSDYSET